jgi:hypothetical protein
LNVPLELPQTLGLSEKLALRWRVDGKDSTTGVDNESIDADLAREYASRQEERC